jgi:hypothetical protein
MRKIPTIFERDWTGDRSRVIDRPHPNCAWVFAGYGIATRKLDGTSCMVRDGKLFRRRELKQGQTEPPGFEIADHDEETGKTVGWVPVGDGPEDKWHRAAFDAALDNPAFEAVGIPNGTYELIGPHIQGGIENDFPMESLVNHRNMNLWLAEPDARTFDGIKAWLSGRDIEGVVFHHPDGRMAKIKKRDFGLRRKP